MYQAIYATCEVQQYVRNNKFRTITTIAIGKVRKFMYFYTLVYFKETLWG